MDQEKQPGIRFLGVYLWELDFAITGPPAKRLQLAPDFDAEIEISEDGTTLDLIVSVDLFPEESPVRFRLKISGQFEVGEEPNMPLEEFARNHALAHLFPYIRELVSSTTSRSPLPTLNLGPVNLVALLKDKEAQLEITWSPTEREQG